MLLLAAWGLIVPALAEKPSSNEVWTPLKVSLWTGVELPNTHCTVSGLGLGLIQCAPGGDYDKVFGLQLNGLLAVSEKVYGVQVSGLLNFVDDGVGLQLSSIFNAAKSFSGVQGGLFNMTIDFNGLQFGVINNIERDFKGLQIGFYNNAKGTSSWREHHRIDNVSFGNYDPTVSGLAEMRGMQLGAFNVALNASGIQCGFINKALSVRGLQLGIHNASGNMKGVQVGLFNVATYMTGLQIGVINHIKENASLPYLPIINAHF